jgi:hypothetical protein
MTDERFTAGSKEGAIELAQLLQQADPSATVEIIFQPPDTFIVHRVSAVDTPKAPGPTSPGPGPGAPNQPGPPPSGADFAERLRLVAGGQWDFFGQQTYDVNGHALRVGHKEGEDGIFQRIGEYWLEGTNTHGLDGRDHGVPWSAAFISWSMKQAGAGNRFRYSTQHSVYISQAIRDRLNARADAGYWGFRLNEQAPDVGDIVCWAREDGVDYDNQKNGNYKGHCDIVVQKSDGMVFVIGGNVGDSVTKRPLRLAPNGFLQPTVEGGETVFALMENRMP